MGSAMVNSSHKSWADEMNDVVIGFFKQDLGGYQLENKISKSPYWGLKYRKGEIEIEIGGDIGFSIGVTIDGTKYPLWQFDRNVNNALDTNEKNILYQLDVLKKFLIGK